MIALRLHLLRWWVCLLAENVMSNQHYMCSEERFISACLIRVFISSASVFSLESLIILSVHDSKYSD